MWVNLHSLLYYEKWVGYFTGWYKCLWARIPIILFVVLDRLEIHLYAPFSFLTLVFRNDGCPQFERGRSASYLSLCLKGSLCLLQHLTSNDSRKQQIRINISLNAERCCLWEFWEADRVLRGQGGQAEVKKSFISFNQEMWTSQHDSWYIPLDTPAFYFMCSEKV